MYDHGHGVPEDDAEAVRWYRRSANRGFAAAQHNLAVMYAEGSGVPEDDAEAVRWYLLAARQGYALAQFTLGGMYSRGEGVLRNEAEGVRWYQLAAEQGDALAQTNLAVILAQRWYRVHIEVQDDPLAAASLALVEQDLINAFKWLTLAADQGNATAEANRDLLRGWMTPAQIAEAGRLSQEWADRRSQIRNEPEAIQAEGR
jgi:TPR repeat protein